MDTAGYGLCSTVGLAIQLATDCVQLWVWQYSWLQTVFNSGFGNTAGYGLCSTVGLAIRIETARSATVLSMGDPHLMEINCKDDRQIELATVVSDGGLWY